MDTNVKEKTPQEEVDDYFNNMELLSDEEIDKLNFYEACLYLEKLNFLDKLTEGEEKENE